MTSGNTNFPHHVESVEAGLLGSVNQNLANWLEVESFATEDFTNQREVLLFMRQHFAKYNTLPSTSQIISSFSLNVPIGEFRYWLDEFKKYTLTRQINSVLIQAVEDMKIDPSKAMSHILDRLSLLRSRQSSHVAASDAEASERIERFDYRSEHIFRNKNMIGIRTGLKVIDSTMEGYIPGSLVGLYARPGVGKTWWLLWSGMHAWMDGKTVLAISGEVPTAQLNLRIDVLAGNMLGHPLEYQKVRQGDPSVRNNYELVTSILAQSQRWWTYDSVNGEKLGLGDISVLIRQHQPDIVLIDGISLLRSESKGQTWEQMKDLVYGLKNIATINEVPILVTHQAVNSARGRRTLREGLAGRGDDDVMPNLNDAAYGDSFVQACSDVITMVAEPTDRNIVWYRIAKHRDRGWNKPLPDRLGLACDFAWGKIYDLSEHGYQPEIVGSEARRLLGK